MKRRMTKAWLRSYEPTHPFAADFRDDALGDRRWRAPRSLWKLLDYLHDRGACDGAVEGARVAWRDFSATWIGWDGDWRLQWQHMADELIADKSCELLEPIADPTFDFDIDERQIRTVLHHMRREGSGFLNNRGAILHALVNGEAAAFEDGSGLLVFTVGDDYVTADIAWVHESFRRRGRATQMIHALRERFPHPLQFDPVTDDGRRFVESLT